ncbi:MAG: alpha/beta hydrolase [Vicinamibacterales bacterium]
MSPALLIGCGLAVSATTAAAQSSPAPDGRQVPSRDYIIGRIAELRRIHTPEGIESLEQVPIGDTMQWVSIRGLHRDNPVLLFIHGGPGTPMLPMAWAYQAPWEDFFTVVQWDQRGVGKNAAGTDPQRLLATLSNDRILDDAEAILAWVRTRLGKDKVVVMGYSYGTSVGLALAQRRPEWISAYVGVGQMSGSGEDYLYGRLLALAGEAGDGEALRELRALAPYPGEKPPIEKILTVRKWARRYNGGWYGKPTFDLMFSLDEWAPEYTQADVDAQRAATGRFTRNLTGGRGGGLPLSALTVQKVPVIVIQGRHDLHTPYEPAKAFVETVQAPHKRFITLERAAHAPMFEQPGEFLLTLVREVLPLTEGQARFAPR